MKTRTMAAALATGMLFMYPAATPAQSYPEAFLRHLTGLCADRQHGQFSATQRIPSLTEFRTIAESGLPGYEAYAWGGMIGPAGMPRNIVQRLNKEIVATLHQKEVTDRMLSEGTVPAPSSPGEFTAYIKAELQKWGGVVKMADIKPE